MDAEAKAAIARMREKMPKYAHDDAAWELLGPPGKMLSASKQAPEGEEVVWNACLFNEAGEQIWHGDFNLTRDEEKLRELAESIGPIFLTREQPARFEGLDAAKKADRSRSSEFSPRCVWEFR